MVENYGNLIRFFHLYNGKMVFFERHLGRFGKVKIVEFGVNPAHFSWTCSENQLFIGHH